MNFFTYFGYTKIIVFSFFIWLHPLCFMKTFKSPIPESYINFDGDLIEFKRDFN